MPSKHANGNDTIAAALTEVSDRLSRLVQDEIELAKTEVSQKASSLARGAAAVAAGAVFGIFAVVFFLLTLAWVLDGIFVTGAGSLWLGFLIVLIVLLALTVGAFLFAWKRLKVGAPTPKMAISEGKKIKDTVTSFGANTSNDHSPASPEAFASVISPALSSVAAAVPEPAIAEPPVPDPATLLTIPEPAAPPPAAAVPAPAVWTEPATAPAATPEQAVTTEPAIDPDLSTTPEPAIDPDPPTFVSVPEPVEETPAAPELVDPPTEPAPPASDPPALLADRPSAVGEEPVYGVEPVPESDTDSPSTGAEN